MTRFQIDDLVRDMTIGAGEPLEDAEVLDRAAEILKRPLSVVEKTLMKKIAQQCRMEMSNP